MRRLRVRRVETPAAVPPRGRTRGTRPLRDEPTRSFPEWAVRQVERLLEARSTRAAPEELAQIDLRLAVLCDSADRYGKSLAEVAELKRGPMRTIRLRAGPRRSPPPSGKPRRTP